MWERWTAAESYEGDVHDEGTSFDVPFSLNGTNVTECFSYACWTNMANDLVQEVVKTMQDGLKDIRLKIKWYQARNYKETSFDTPRFQGLFARLTWWEYSWDIMEPVTYFATYATVVATFGYYLYTKQAFEYPTARERAFTKQFYRRAAKEGFDIEKYNVLVTEVEEVRKQLARIRDPLFQHLPVSHLSRLEDEEAAKSEDPPKHSPNSG
ncbi:unnamed protein product [Heligmosomoides polygyrus]|uniref:Calcium uniporter protein n=1 Tax=Heligmosomoides polygyrus TaxID=6339 RepID=A0A183FSJ6_HELPZ|nr:unnamed protein product [Heligmosomoides polygyrus]